MWPSGRSRPSGPPYPRVPTFSSSFLPCSISWVYSRVRIDASARLTVYSGCACDGSGPGGGRLSCWSRRPRSPVGIVKGSVDATWRSPRRSPRRSRRAMTTSTPLFGRAALFRHHATGGTLKIGGDWSIGLQRRRVRRDSNSNVPNLAAGMLRIIGFCKPRTRRRRSATRRTDSRSDPFECRCRHRIRCRNVRSRSPSGRISWSCAAAVRSRGTTICGAFRDPACSATPMPGRILLIYRVVCEECVYGWLRAA